MEILFQLLSHSWESNLTLSWPKSSSIPHLGTASCELNSNVIQLFSPQSSTSVQFRPCAVYASSSICSSTCRASGNPNCLVRRSQGDHVVGRTTREGRGGGGGVAALVALVGGKETGAYFLWKWGYHFPNYYCNYRRRPCLGTKPMGMQMGRHEGQIQKSFVIGQSTLSLRRHSVQAPNRALFSLIFTKLTFLD